MRLAIETAHAACSVALLTDEVVASRHERIGRGHAERLAPMIAEIIDAAGAPPSAILVDIGPGSFTGIRVGLAASKALGLVWRVPVTGFSATAIVAARAFASDAALDALAVSLDAGRGERFVERFARGPRSLGAPAALPAAAVAAAASGLPVFAEGEPDAADVLLLPAAQCSLAAQPIYVRAPDAKLPAA